MPGREAGLPLSRVVGEGLPEKVMFKPSCREGGEGASHISACSVYRRETSVSGAQGARPRWARLDVGSEVIGACVKKL